MAAGEYSKLLPQLVVRCDWVDTMTFEGKSRCADKTRAINTKIREYMKYRQQYNRSAYLNTVKSSVKMMKVWQDEDNEEMHAQSYIIPNKGQVEKALNRVYTEKAKEVLGDKM